MKKWKKQHKESFAPVDIGSNLVAGILGADFYLYGPIENRSPRPDHMTSSSNRPATTTVTSESDEGRERALNLSFTNIAGGALAAVTTAVAASFIGVSGTVTGAAFGSVVSSVAAALYAASLKTAHSRIRTTRTVVGQGGAGDPQDPSALPAELTGRSMPLPGETMVFPTPEGQGGPTPGAVPPAPRYRERSQSRSGRFPWKPVAALAGLVFVVAMGAIFATELVIGHPISNSRETGTTVSRVVQGDVAPAERTKKSSSTSTGSSSESPSSSTTSESPSPTDTASLAPGETTQSGDTTSAPQSSDGQTSQDPNGQGQNSPGQNSQGQTPSPADSAAGAGGAGAAVGGAAVPTNSP
jgi:hypothetical protein